MIFSYSIIFIPTLLLPPFLNGIFESEQDWIWVLGSCGTSHIRPAGMGALAGSRDFGLKDLADWEARVRQALGATPKQGG